MPFNFLLANQFYYGTSFKERGVSVSIKSKKDETFIFFHLDSDNNRRLRKYLGIGDTSRICDLLIYYFNKHDDKPSICLVELKGEKVSDAIPQIESAYDAFSKKLKDKHIFDDFSWGALIMQKSNSSAPTNNKQLLNKLKQKGLVCKTTKKDAAEFIRTIS